MNIVKTNIKDDFNTFVNILIDKFKIKDKDSFVKDLMKLINTLDVKKNNNISELEEKYYLLIRKYSVEIEELIKEAGIERKSWKME